MNNIKPHSFVVVNLGVILNSFLVIVFVEHSDERGENRFITRLDEVGECLPEVCSGFLQVIVWDLSKHVVHLVGTNAMNDFVYCAIVPINGAELTTDEIPLFISVPRNASFRMVKEGDDHHVASKDEIRNDIIAKESQEAM